jgi:thioredoxin reductase (NADPH)
MSNYLIERIKAAANISIYLRTGIVELNGEAQPESIK